MNTDIIVILDRSGSMTNIRADVEGGFNAFIAEQRKLPDPCFVTLTQFDSDSIDTVYERKPLVDVPALSFTPRSCTPLLDAVGRTITKALTQPLSERVLVIILTDGYENASQEWTKAGVKKLLEERQKAGWAVIFLAANVDAFEEARQYGINASTAAGYAATSKGVQAAISLSSQKSLQYRSGVAPTFTDADRQTLQDEQ